jgi:hypothetical protein
MRSFQKLTAVAAGASLVAVIGVAFAQAAQVGPDADVSNNETKTGIQANSNNSYKTWPQALHGDQQTQAATAPATQVSQAPDNSTSTAATDNSSTAAQPAPADNTATAGGTTDNSAAMPAPKADRN